MNASQTEFEVTLTDDLYCFLRREARRLGVPLRYLVASVVLDTLEGVEEETNCAGAMPALAC